MIPKLNLKFGDIVWTNFDPSVGHEFRGNRPAVVIQSSKQLRKSNLVSLLPITSNIKNVTSDDISVHPDDQNRLYSDSVIKVYYVTTFDYTRLESKIGKISKEIEKSIKSYLRKHFDI